MCKKACLYVFIQETYIKAHVLVFSPISAHFYPPLHHNGKGSIASLRCLHGLATCMVYSVWHAWFAV